MYTHNHHDHDNGSIYLTHILLMKKKSLFSHLHGSSLIFSTHNQTEQSMGVSIGGGGGTGGADPPPPDYSQNYNILWFHSNTGSDPLGTSSARQQNAI